MNTAFFSNIQSAAKSSTLKPTTLQEVGISPSLLQSLLLKHLLEGDVLTLLELSNRLALTGTIVQQLLDQAKQAKLVENKHTTDDGQLRFALSGKGRQAAQLALEKSGYMGCTPIPLEQYWQVCLQQSSRQHHITRTAIHHALQQMAFPEATLGLIGPALNSKRPVLIYGPPGTGKSFLCRHLNLIFGDDVLVPHAICIGRSIIQIFDPLIHELHEKEDEVTPEASLLMGKGHDPRWHRCRRPLMIVGGELSPEMLNVHYDRDSRTYHAPIGLKANNGVLLIDDLGRQQITPKQIFNRWIVPMEESKDYLSLPSGEHFEVPFEQILLFSTNLEPTELVDEAFLRRLGYKIPFTAISAELFQIIWRQNCDQLGLPYEPETCQWVVDTLYPQHQKPLLPCHPRDLLSIVADQINYNELPKKVTQQLLRQAWSTYFVQSLD